jgi:hypothetical protein
MIPLVIIGLIGGLMALASRSKKDTIGFEPDPTPRQRMRQLADPAYRQAFLVEENVAPGMMGPPLQPEEERLFTLLILWGKDKKYPKGRKRYFNGSLAKEAAKIALRLGLRGTARAVLSDGFIPAQERLGTRGVTVMDALAAYSNSKKPKEI